MNPGLAILWIGAGAAAGWVGTRVMGTYARPRALANLFFGILGAVIAGFVTRQLAGANLGLAGVFLGLGGALGGACLLLLIFGWRTLSRRQV